MTAIKAITLAAIASVALPFAADAQNLNGFYLGARGGTTG
jgi:hypothetical protein